MAVGCSVRSRRPPIRDRQGEPYGAEAKEFLRKKLIGKDVQVGGKDGQVPGRKG